MANRSALTEEGRTRIRNFQGRLFSYFVLWVVIGSAFGLGAIWVRTRYGYLPLQRLYLGQYAKASIKSFLPRKQHSNYVLLVRVVDDQAQEKELVIPCSDHEVTPVRDEKGVVRFHPKLGPFFQLKEGIPYKYFYWHAVRQNDREMYLWFRDRIYDGRSIIGVYWFCFLPLPIVMTAGMAFSIKLDLRINREYEEGRLVRGIRLLRSKEYSREMATSAGLGLPVFRRSKE